MAKITLEFDAIEEAQEARNAINGGRWKALVWDLDQKLRNTIKYESSVITYGDKPATEVEIMIAEQYREILQELINDYGLNLE